MGEIVKFERGCFRCSHLVQIGKNTYMCESQVHLDDTTIVPILNGKKNEEDWNACDGEDYKAIVVDKHRRRRSS